MPKVSLWKEFQNSCTEEIGASTRITKNIRLSSMLHELLLEHCAKDSINKSTLLEQLMKKYLKHHQQNVNYQPMTTEDYIIILSNYGIDLRNARHLDRKPFAFRLYENIYEDFCNECEQSGHRICDILEAMIAAFLIQENNLTIVRLTKYSRLSEQLHNEFAKRCKTMGIGKSELMEYFFSYYIENSRQNPVFQFLLESDYDKVKELYHTDLRKPTHIPRIICAFRLYEELYDNFCAQCTKNERRICDVVEEMIATFLLETEGLTPKPEKD